MKNNVFRVIPALGFLSAMLAGSASGGCGGVTVASVCQEICACRRCTSNDLADCEKDGKQAEDQAEGAGCGDQFDDFVVCVKGNIRCEEEEPSFGDCAAEAEVLAKCTKGVNPLLDPCKVAADKITTCLNISSGSGGGGEPPPDCNGQTACVAACINAATCEELQDAFNGQPTPQSQPFIDCVTNCSNSGSSSSSGPSGSSGSTGSSGSSGVGGASGTGGAGGSGGG